MTHLNDYTPALEAQIGAWAESQLDPGRVPHVRGVVETAARLAEKHAPHEIPRVRLAGWIHDAAKNWDDARLLAYAEEHALPVTPAERAVPMLLHGADADPYFAAGVYDTVTVKPFKRVLP